MSTDCNRKFEIVIALVMSFSFLTLPFSFFSLLECQVLNISILYTEKKMFYADIENYELMYKLINSRLVGYTDGYATQAMKTL